MRPKYIKCPKCDGLNYMEEGEESCPACKPPVTTPYQVRTRGGRVAKVPKPKAEGNIAFKSTYCDGGKNATQLGFAGVCSQANIKTNIEVKNRTWCRG